MIKGCLNQNPKMKNQKPNGRLVFIPKEGDEVTLINNKPFPLLQADKKQYSYMPDYQKSKGELRLRYAN